MLEHYTKKTPAPADHIIQALSDVLIDVILLTAPTGQRTVVARTTAKRLVARIDELGPDTHQTP
jgi:hypothetical protein